MPLFVRLSAPAGLGPPLPADPGGETATFTGVLHTAGAEDGPGPQGQLTAAILKAVRALSNPVMQGPAGVAHMCAGISRLRAP